MRKRLLVLALAILPAPAFAQNVQIQLGGNAQTVANQLGLNVNQLESLISDQIAAYYSVNDVPEYLRLSANAQSLINKGVGVDYGSNPTGFLFGIAVAGAVDTGESDVSTALENLNFDPSERVVPVGIGAQISLMLGYNFTRQGVPGLTLYANGLAFPLQVDEYDADFYNFGFHAQYNLWGHQTKNKTFNWGGLDLTSGFEFSQMRLNLAESLPASIPLSANGGSVQLSTDAVGTLELVQTAWTVPVEVTTAFTLFYFASLYTGVAADFQFGGASIDADLSDDDLEISGVPGVDSLGSVRIDASEDNGPTPVLFRVLVGLQFNLGPVKVFGQVNVQPNNLPDGLTTSAAGGVRVLFK